MASKKTVKLCQRNQKSIGIIFTIFSVVNALGVLDSDSHAFMAVLCGVIGIPLTYASILSLCKKPNV